MKKVLSLIIILTLILASFSAVGVSAASDFQVEDGVLVSYSGKSTSVTIPSDVYYIADSAFEGNTKITAVNLSNVEMIGDKAFYNCTSLATVTNSSAVTSCGAYAFFNTPFLGNNNETNVILGSVLIDSSAKGVFTVPDSVTALAPYSCAGNTAITSVTVGDNVSEIGEGAFYNCSSLKTVAVSDTVSYIGAFAFEGTEWLSAQNDDFVILGSNILVDVNTTASAVSIPDTVRQIAAGAFYRNTKLKSVTIPDSVTSIGMRAFAGCTSLSNAELPHTLVMLDKEAFTGCTSLDSVEIPASVQLLGDSVFLGCTSLTTAAVYTDADISSGLFAGCTSLEAVYIASDTERIGDYAFYNCSELQELSVPDTVTLISTSAFSGCDKLTVFCNDSSYIALQCQVMGITAYQIGDANLDGKVNVRDATHVQKATADLVTFDFSATLRGDADFSGEVNIRDATQIQKLVAGIA